MEQKDNFYQEKLLNMIFDLRIFANKGDSATSNESKAIVINWIYKCFLEMKDAYTKGKLMPTEYLANLFLLVSAIDNGYLEKVPELEIEIIHEWGKQRKEHLGIETINLNE